MRRLLLILAVVMFAAGITSVSHAQSSSVMTLEDAIRIGLDNNYSIRIARNAATVARNNRGLGTAEFLPRVDLSANYRLSSTNETTNSPFSFGSSETENFGAGATATWTLFDGFTMFVNRKRFNELAGLGEAEARRAIEQTVVSISRAYLNVVQQEQLLDVARDTREISADRLEREKVRNDLGGATVNLLNARVAFNNDESSVLTQELQVATSREQLNVLLGRDPQTPLVVTGSIEVPDVADELPEVLRMADSTNATLDAARLNKSVADRAAQAARGPFLPQLDLVANYEYSDRTVSSDASQFTEDINTETKASSIGFVLSYNIFNGNRDRIDYRNARIDAHSAQLDLRDAENRVRANVKEAHSTLQQRISIVRIEEENVITAQQNLDLISERYELGVATSLDFRDAQVNLARARIALIVASFQARVARLELDRLTGQLETNL